MNKERWIYLSSLEKLASLSLVKLMSEASALIKEWSEQKNRSDLRDAACYYLTHFVIPWLDDGYDPNAKIPQKISDTLFYPLPDEISDLQTWLSLFPGFICEALNERGTSRSVPIEEITPDVIKRNNEKNYGLYFTPNAITGTKLSDKGSRKIDENVGRLNALFLDFDGGNKEEQRKKLADYPVPPSYLVESKNGYHAYWLLYEGMTKDEWKIQIKRLINFFGSDRLVSFPSHLMRLPFTWHTKTDEKFFTRVEVWSGKRYHLWEVVAPLPKEKRTSLHYRLQSQQKQLEPTTLGTNERHAGLVEEVARLYVRQPIEKAQENREQAVRWYEQSCHPLKPHWNKEANDYCDWIEQKQYGSIVSHNVP